MASPLFNTYVHPIKKLTTPLQPYIPRRFASNPGFFKFSSRIGGTAPSAGISEVHPGVPVGNDIQPTGPRSANITTLANGIRVASITSTSPVAGLRVYIGSGSRNESRELAGATHFLKHLVFKSTTSRPTIQVVRDIETLGATFSATAGREHLLFESEVLPENASSLLAIFGDLLHPRIANFEVDRQREHLEEELDHLAADPATTLIELVHREAFRSRGLGQPVAAPKYNVEHLDHDTLAKYARTHYTPRNTVVVAVGVPHNELVEGVNRLFSVAESGEPPKVEPSKYVGGEARVPGGGDTHIALAFEGVSAKDSKDGLATQVLRQLLGGGSHYSRDGPGAGLQSRLHANFVAPNAAVKAALAFNINYSDSGLFGVYARVSDNVAGAVDSLVKEIGSVLAKVDETEVNRAKQLLKLEILTGKVADMLQFVCQQAVAGSSSIQTPEQVASQIDALTAADVARVAKRIFGTRPTLAVLGDVSSVPSLDSIKTSLSKK